MWEHSGARGVMPHLSEDEKIVVALDLNLVFLQVPEGRVLGILAEVLLGNAQLGVIAWEKKVNSLWLVSVVLEVSD